MPKTFSHKIGAGLLLVASAAFSQTPASPMAFDDLGIPMLHWGPRLHEGVGVLQITRSPDTGIAWNEKNIATGKVAHSFSVRCADVREASLYYPPKSVIAALPDASFPDRIKIRVPSGAYDFVAAQGHSNIVFLDRIKMVCGMGDFALESSRERLQPGPEGVGKDPLPAEEISVDTFLYPAGGRGVLFISRTGLRFEQVSNQPIRKMAFRGSTLEIPYRAVRTISLSCSSLTDITALSFWRSSNGPEITVNGTLRFIFGTGFDTRKVKADIADMCSRQ